MKKGNKGGKSSKRKRLDARGAAGAGVVTRYADAEKAMTAVFQGLPLEDRVYVRGLAECWLAAPEDTNEEAWTGQALGEACDRLDVDREALVLAAIELRRAVQARKGVR